jgi:hypothetical protein
MTEANQEPSSARPTTAGGLLKQARQAKGLHIAALAASSKPTGLASCQTPPSHVLWLKLCAGV